MNFVIEEARGRVEGNTVCVFEVRWETEFSMVMFSLLDDVCEDLHKFEGVRYLNACVHQHFKVVLERAC